jgi:preprotein translocase subunit Sss1
MLIDQGREDEIFEMTSATAALFMFILVTVIGFIISLISGLILQRKN